MKQKFSLDKLAAMSELDSIYDFLRVLSNKNNEFDTRCIGSGMCCRIGLMLPMIECCFIAHHIYHKYMLLLEGEGVEAADEYRCNVIEDLKKALKRNQWTVADHYPKDDEHCAFYKNGCTIYEARPFICRAYGTITTVDDYCPRKRNANGQVTFFKGKDVYKLVVQFKSLVEFWGQEWKDENMVVYMPVGVLHFLLSEPEMIALQKESNPEMWKAVETYKVALFEDLERENA